MERAKLVRCQRHGTLYNPRKYDGCAICRSGAQSETQAGSVHRGVSALSVAAVLTVVLGGFFLFGKVTRVMADRGAEIAASGPDLRLDPEPFRNALEEIEQVVFAADSRPAGQGAALFGVASRLSEQIRQHVSESGNMLVRATAQRYSTEVLTFGRRQAATEDVGYAAFDLDRAARDWLDVRKSVFRDASWFQSAVGASGADGSVMSPMVVRMLKDLATSLENTARFGRQQAMDIAEIDRDPRSVEMRRAQQAWETFCQSLTTRLTSALSRLPDEGVMLTPEAQRAHAHLQEAVAQLSSLARYPAVPPMEVRRNAFDIADRSITEGRRLLERL